MTSILPAPLKIQELSIITDPARLIWNFTLRCQTKKYLSLITQLTMILKSPMDAERITFESKDIKIFKDSIDLPPGLENFSREITFDELQPTFQTTINEIMHGRKNSFPLWRLKLFFTDDTGSQTYAQTFKPAPEKWFWNFERGP